MVNLKHYHPSIISLIRGISNLIFIIIAFSIFDQSIFGSYILVISLIGFSTTVMVLGYPTMLTVEFKKSVKRRKLFFYFAHGLTVTLINFVLLYVSSQFFYQLSFVIYLQALLPVYIIGRRLTEIQLQLKQLVFVELSSLTFCILLKIASIFLGSVSLFFLGQFVHLLIGSTFYWLGEISLNRKVKSKELRLFYTKSFDNLLFWINGFVSQALMESVKWVTALYQGTAAIVALQIAHSIVGNINSILLVYENTIAKLILDGKREFYKAKLRKVFFTSSMAAVLSSFICLTLPSVFEWHYLEQHKDTITNFGYLCWIIPTSAIFRAIGWHLKRSGQFLFLVYRQVYTFMFTYGVMITFAYTQTIDPVLSFTMGYAGSLLVLLLVKNDLRHIY